MWLEKPGVTAKARIVPCSDPVERRYHLKMAVNASQYVKRVIRPAVVRYSIRNRRAKAAAISEWLTAHECKTLLMIGALPLSKELPNEGIVEDAVMSGRDVVMGINVVPYEMSYPFQVADGCDMPFEDDYVDCALANAIIEHVGDEQRQRELVAEASRVARCWVITTPNRWFPIESHTSTLLVHWLPGWRRKRAEFTRLLSLREFKALLPPEATVTGEPWSATFSAFYDRASTQSLEHVRGAAGPGLVRTASIQRRHLGAQDLHERTLGMIVTALAVLMVSWRRVRAGSPGGGRP
jgi:hypothetical protein